MVCRDGLHIPNAPRRKPRILTFPSHHALSLFLFRRLWNSKAHGRTAALMKQIDWRRVRTWRNGSGKPILLRLPFRSLRSSRLMSADSLDRTTRTRATPGLDGRRAAVTLGYLASRFEHQPPVHQRMGRDPRLFKASLVSRRVPAYFLSSANLALRFSQALSCDPLLAGDADKPNGAARAKSRWRSKQK